VGRHNTILIVLAVLMLLSEAPPVFAQPAGRRPSDDLWTSDVEAARAQYSAVASTLGVTGEDRGANAAAYVVTIPRTDLHLMHAGMAVPPEAGLEHRLWFWRCPCGKLLMHGQIVLTDAEFAPTTAALSRGGIQVGAASEVLPGSQPRVLSLRVSGEGDPHSMANTLRNNLVGLVSATTQPTSTR
jgi:hypothetical protein